MSTLVQGGLEIPIKANAKRPNRINWPSMNSKNWLGRSTKSRSTASLRMLLCYFGKTESTDGDGSGYSDDADEEI